MKARSAKNKGAEFQREVRDAILQYFPDLTQNDIRSTTGGANGVDILLSEAAIEAFPFSVECKRSERVDGKYLDQVLENVIHGTHPLLVFRWNRSPMLVAFRMNLFTRLFSDVNIVTDLYEIKYFSRNKLQTVDLRNGQMAKVVHKRKKEQDDGTITMFVVMRFDIFMKQAIKYLSH